MVLTVTEDTPADMLAGSMELLVQLPREHHVHTQKVTVQRSTPMMDLLVQIATANKLAASSYTLQAIGERGLVLPHQPNTPIGVLDALQVKLLPKQGTFVPRKTKQVNQPFETTFRLQVHLPRNQLYVSRVSPKMNLGEILEEVCREKNLDKNKYELRHPANLEESLDLSLSLQDYHLQEVTLYAKQGRSLGSALSTQDIMALQRQEERRRQQAKQGVFGFMFKKSKEGSLSTDSLGGRSASPARSDGTARSSSPLQPPARPQRKRRPAPKPPILNQLAAESGSDSNKDKVVISHSRNSSDSSGYHEASVLSDNPDSAGRLPETLPRRHRAPGAMETPRKLAHTSQSSKSLCNLATVSGTLSHGISSTSLSSTGQRKKRAAPPPPVTRPLSSAISTQGLERIVDSEESLTSDMEPSKPPSDIDAPSKASSDIEDRPKASSDIGISTVSPKSLDTVDAEPSQELVLKTSTPTEPERPSRSGPIDLVKSESSGTVAEAPIVESAKVIAKRAKPTVGPAPLPLPRKLSNALVPPKVPKRRLAPSSSLTRHPDLDPNQPSENEPKKPSDETIEKSLQDQPFDDADDEVFYTPVGEMNFDAFDESLTKKNDLERGKIEDNTDNEQVESEEYKLALSSNNSTQLQTKKSLKEEKKICSVISTMPKCEHLGDDIVISKSDIPTSSSGSQIKDDDYSLCIEKVLNPEERDVKAMKVHRSTSKANDFETNSLEKQKRHFTSLAEDITFAINVNVSSIGLPKEVDDSKVERICTQDEGITDTASGPTETDILLQKVSDTLSNSLSISSTEEVSDEPNIETTTGKSLENTIAPTEALRNTPPKPSVYEETTDSSKETPLNTSGAPLSSQQDTSDYVSAVDDDLSIPDWEYQLPAPPSAFRDTASPSLDADYDTITLGSVDAFKEPIAHIMDEDSSSQSQEEKQQKEQRPENKVLKTKEEIPEGRTKQMKRPESSANLKKEVINELENKIGSGTLPQTNNKEAESRRVVNTSSTPQIAPVDNTLSNFTISTYTRQKSLNIFDEVDSQKSANLSDERFMKSFPTLSRNKSIQEFEDEPKVASGSSTTLQHKRSTLKAEYASLNDVELRRTEPKRNEIVQRWQSVNGNEKTSVHRSRSYISTADTVKQNQQLRTRDAYDDEATIEQDGMKKSTSVTNLNAEQPKGNEKFSQWRDNILKKQEEPTKEKQLQSLQVLKSILPQLKYAQQAEENVSKEPGSATLDEKARSETGSDEHSTMSNVAPTCESQATVQRRSESNLKKQIPEETSKKRYTYSGPPAISLGSWTERPNVNVQIKMDSDYKFGGLSKANNGKTIVNINGSKDERDETPKKPERTASMKHEKEDKKEPDELAKKLITHTTASGFRKPVLNKVNLIEPKASPRSADKPVVTGVELKKVSIEKTDKNNESTIDTSSVNFQELTKAFGEVCLRSKPRRLNTNRFSEHYDHQSESIQRLDTNIKQNGHCDLPNGQIDSSRVQNNVKPRRYTSVVGINHNQNGHSATLPLRNNINVTKSNHSMPVVKGFKISTAASNGIESQKTPQPPKPPTMPIITGVTLKSSRPKSMPVQMDPRDTLLESIRNFGGRENLKSVAQRC